MPFKRPPPARPVFAVDIFCTALLTVKRSTHDDAGPRATGASWHCVIPVLIPPPPLTPPPSNYVHPPAAPAMDVASLAGSGTPPVVNVGLPVALLRPIRRVPYARLGDWGGRPLFEHYAGFLSAPKLYPQLAPRHRPPVAFLRLYGAWHLALLDILQLMNAEGSDYCAICLVRSSDMESQYFSTARIKTDRNAGPCPSLEGCYRAPFAGCWR